MVPKGTLPLRPPRRPETAELERVRLYMFHEVGLEEKASEGAAEATFGPAFGPAFGMVRDIRAALEGHVCVVENVRECNHVLVILSDGALVLHDKVMTLDEFTRSHSDRQISYT